MKEVKSMDYIIVWCILTAVVQGVASGFCKGKRDGNYPNPENCGGFITCHATYATPMACPSGLHYNPKNGVCDYIHALVPPCKESGTGNWGAWSGYSSCTVTCGVGIQVRSKLCSPNGEKCLNEDGTTGKIKTETKSCNSNPCDKVEPPVPPPPPAPAACGIDKQLDLGEVVGGTNAQRNRWIWQGGLYYDDEFLCGGTLIRPDTFLTAAHCVSNKDAFLMTVRMGDHQRSKIEPTEQTLAVDEVIVHSGWDWSTIQNDIAILKFSKEFKLNDYVGTACLPSPSSTVPKDAKCYITGWGRTNANSANADILQEAEMPVVPNKDCKLRNVNKRGESKLTDNMMCAGFQGPASKVSGCRGDSGGPYVCKDKNNWFLQGLVSWGSNRCDALHRYTVFTRISKYINWIDTQSYPDP